MSTPKHSPDAIFFSAMELEDSASRLEYVASACGNDDRLRAKVLELLNARKRESDGQLQDGCMGSREAAFGSPDALAQTAATAESAPARGTELDFTQGESGIDISKRPIIGHYKLLEQIGEGGMGAVYMAQQSQPVKRRVALKLIKKGMSSRDVIARFEAERQALAMMDHPNIARVLDGGTTEEGSPYFVMELVRGVPIDRYCESQRLDVRQRLELFVDVCKAVQHAHHKGIIHRDLKPSNVMVTVNDGEPLVKVIDFGVAKALNQELTEKTLFTQFGANGGDATLHEPRADIDEQPRRRYS